MAVTRRSLLAAAAIAATQLTEARAQAGALDATLRSADFSGAALVNKRGVALHRAAYGLASHEHGIANTSETRFLIASITKTMTAGATLKLAAANRIDLDAPISRYVDAPQAWAAIRVFQLLNHSSGLPDIVRQPNFGERVARRTSLEETVAFIRDLPLDFSAGSQSVYGNSGAIVAARIVELVSAMPYPEYLQTEIYQPMGMANSGFADRRAVIPHLADGYRMREGVSNRADFLDMTVTLGAGSEYSTVGDLSIWIEALEANRLTPRELTRRMFTPNSDGYGLAWQIQSFERRSSVSHVGDINGFGSYLLRLPEDDVTVVLLSNMEGTRVRSLAESLARSALRT